MVRFRIFATFLPDFDLVTKRKFAFIAGGEMSAMGIKLTHHVTGICLHVYLAFTTLLPPTCLLLGKTPAHQSDPYGT